MPFASMSFAAPLDTGCNPLAGIGDAQASTITTFTFLAGDLSIYLIWWAVTTRGFVSKLHGLRSVTLARRGPSLGGAAWETTRKSNINDFKQEWARQARLKESEFEVLMLDYEGKKWA